MKKKIRKVAVMCALGAAVCMAVTNFTANRESESSMLSANVEALTDGEGTTYKYPNKEGSAKFCTIYKYFKAGVLVSTGNTEDPQYEGNVEYTKQTLEGLKDNCPDKGSGCNPYSCQEVPYTPV